VSLIGIITAMPTEVWPLIRNWQRQSQQHNGRTFRFFESSKAVVLPGGIGHEAGSRATQAVIALYRPELLIATGLAGGLKPQWTLGRTLIAAEVINSATGRRFRTAGGDGVVISSRIIAGAEEKRRLAAAFPEADVVDMEGAAVAEVASESGLPFLAVKAVSDNLEFNLPPLNRFVDAEGGFETARFTAWAAVRPWWWPKIIQLKRISDYGARALADLLNSIIRDKGSAARAMISGSEVTSVTKNGN
jgi:adenosylhomocysteine nucleosidase